MDILNDLHRFWTDLLSRPSGPYAFRFVFQPIMATVVAVLNGIQDARTGRSPYFWSLLHEPAQRQARLKEGLKATTRILVLGLLLEVLYQWKSFHTFYLFEAVVIVLSLCFLPYLLLRGPAARLARWWFARRERAAPHPPGAG